MAKFTLELSDGFKGGYHKKPPEVRIELNDVLRFLADTGPKHPSLNTHPLEDRKAQRDEKVRVWESYITWSHRVTWHYKPNWVIFLRSTNGHEILP